jgi:hypothetical protein
LIYIFFRLFATMLGLRVLPSPILVFPPKWKTHTKAKQKIDVCLMIEEKSFKKEMTTVITAAAMCV